MFKSIMDTIKGALRKMGIIKQIKDVSQVRDLPINDEYYQLIEKWKSLYAGYYPDWHDTVTKTIEGQKNRRMSTMNMPKVMSQEMASLVFNEKCEVNIDKPGVDDFVKAVFKKNRFMRNFQTYLEYMFGTGGHVIKPYYDGKTIRLSFVTADCFIPLAWNNEMITEGVFINETYKGKKKYTNLEWHTWEDGTYTVTNHLYRNDDGTSALGHQVDLSELYPDLDEIVPMNDVSRPLFVYMKPNIANNIDIKSPLGVPLYGHALDTIRAIDIAFDSFEREFRLGKRRIIIPSTAVRHVTDEYGNKQRYFDTSDEIYEAMTMGGIDDPGANKIHDNSVELRVDEHIAAINALLNILSAQTGFSSGAFSFDGQGVKTATEVVSENSKTFRSKQSHETIIESALGDLAEAIVQLGELYELTNGIEGVDDFEVTVQFDDSIAEDKTAEVEREIQLVAAKLQTKVRALMKIHGIPEKEAKRLLKEIQEENATSNPDPTAFGLTDEDESDDIEVGGEEDEDNE